MFSNVWFGISDDDKTHKNDAENKDKNRNVYLSVDNNRLLDGKKIVQNGAAKMKSKTEKHSRLHKATSEGLICVVKSIIIDDGTLIESLDDNGFCPLHIAARYNRVQIVNTLLDFGAVCDTYSLPDGVTPLHVASRFNSLETARILLERGANPNAESNTGATPLHIASRFNNTEIVRLLVSNPNTDIEYRENIKCTPIHYAASYGHHEVVQILVDHGADVEACAVENFSVLHTAVIGGTKEAVSVVIDAAVQRYLKSPVSVFTPQENDSEFVRFISAKNDSGNTPLHLAIKSGSLEVTKLIINFNVDPNARTNSNQTPLHIAAMCGECEAVAVLLSAHAQMNCQDEDMKTPLHYAASFGNERVIKHLLDHGAQVNIQDVNKMTPFLGAVTVGRLECARLLLEYGADISALDAHGRCCLHLAVENEHEQIVALLMQNKARNKLVNHSEPEKERTPLHYAAIIANTKILELILQCKPNCILKDINRKTALHLAAESGKARFVEMLARSGLTALFDRDEMLRTPLHYAAMNKRRKVCMILLQFGAETDCQDLHRWTPIMWAAKSGDQAIMAIFLEREVQIDRTDSEGNTLLHVACSNGHVDVTKQLLDNEAEILLNNNEKSCLDCAIEHQNGDVVMAIVKHNRWEEIIRVRGCNARNTMSSLIQHYPEVAEVVMDRCVQRTPTSITYNFRYLDPGPDDCSGLRKDRYIGLADMVKYKRQDLLIHPLAKKLLHMKWEKCGKTIFVVNCFLYVFFISMMSIFLTQKRRKLLIKEYGFHITEGDSESLINEEELDLLIPLAVTVIAVFHMLKEVYQMFNLGLQYFKDAINLLEWCLHGSAFMFMLPFLIKNGWIRSQPKLFWHIGTCSLFLGFANLILYLRVLSHVGLFVTMYLEVVKTLLKVMSLFVIFIVAFSLVFYILFKEEEAFENFYKSIVKTTVMTVGEIDYAALLVDGLHAETETTGAKKVPFPEMSFVFFYIFLLAMPIVLMNLLIGLAVGDIDAIQQSAFLTNKSMKINFVSDVESKYPKFITRRIYKPEVTVYNTRFSLKKLYGGNIEFSTVFDDEVGDEDIREDPTTVQIRDVKQELLKTRQQVKTLVATMDKQRELLVAMAAKNGIAFGDVAKEKSRIKKRR